MSIFHVFEQPPIELLGIRINEPIITLTDLMVSAMCFYAFMKLRKIPVKNKVHLYFKYYFLSMGIATFLGGIIGHGFIYLFKAEWTMPEKLIDHLSVIFGEKNMNSSQNPFKLPGWLTSMFSVALAERAVIEYARKIISPALGKFFGWLNIIELLTFMTITFLTLNFYFVEVHTFYGFMIVVNAFSWFVLYKTKSQGSKMFLIAVGLAAIAALFFMNQWGISIWITHLDISHTFMTLSAYFFYRGALIISKKPEAELATKTV